MTAALRLQSDSLSHEGCVRSRNEDSYLADDGSRLWVVADGMGGHDHGEWASAAIVDQFRVGLPQLAFEDGCREIAGRIHHANGLIYGEAELRGMQMGSTVVTLYVHGRRFAVLWVGDSRAYLLRDGRLHQLSKDHTQVQEMLDRGLLTAAEAEGHPMGHVLARAVGVQPTVEVDVVQDEIESNDTFLLCSDGLHGYLAEAEIAARLAEPALDGVARDLVEMTIARGAPDNVTVIAVRFTEATLLAFAGAGAA